MCGLWLWLRWCWNRGFDGEFRDLCRDGLCLVRFRDGPNYAYVESVCYT